jgi:ATP-dependent Zn protease
VLTDQHDRARQILYEHRRALDAVAEALIEHEKLSGDTVSRIVREITTAAASLRPAG